MRKITSFVERLVSRRFPNLFLKIIQQPRNISRFQIERQLSRGKKLSTSNRPSILFFSTQKCASRYVNRIITKLANSANMVHADYDAYVSMVPLPKEQRIFATKERMREAFQPTGYYYGPIGSFRQIPGMEKYRVVLQLRDPRDVLTSLYYSTAFSHAVINPKVVRRRKQALEMDIDSFVLNEIDNYLPIYDQYCDSLLGKDWALFLKYEDMVGDFPSWLKSISAHMGLNSESHALQEILANADFSIDKENKYAQRRQITPGEHLRRLQAGTIEQLNERFAPILEKLGYIR